MNNQRKNIILVTSTASCVATPASEASQGTVCDEIQLAWERAVQKAGGRKITALLVKKAVKELQLGGNTPPAAKKAGPTRAERRRLIDDTIGQLLALVSKKADHSLLQQKIEALHGHIQALFAKRPGH